MPLLALARCSVNPNRQFATAFPILVQQLGRN